MSYLQNLFIAYVFLILGTLDSGSVTAFIASMGMLENQGDGDRELNSTFPASVPPPPRSIKFSVQATCPWFKFPKTFTIPSPLTFGPKLASDMIRDKSGPNDQQVYASNITTINILN